MYKTKNSFPDSNHIYLVIMYKQSACLKEHTGEKLALYEKKKKKVDSIQWCIIYERYLYQKIFKIPKVTQKNSLKSEKISIKIRPSLRACVIKQQCYNKYTETGLPGFGYTKYKRIHKYFAHASLNRSLKFFNQRITPQLKYVDSCCISFCDVQFSMNLQCSTTTIRNEFIEFQWQQNDEIKQFEKSFGSNKVTVSNWLFLIYIYRDVKYNGDYKYDLIW